MLLVVQYLKIIFSKILSRFWQKGESSPCSSFRMPFSNLHGGSLLVSEVLIVMICPQGLCTGRSLCLEDCFQSLTGRLVSMWLTCSLHRCLFKFYLLSEF